MSKFKVGGLVHCDGYGYGRVEGMDGARVRILLLNGERVVMPQGDVALPGEDAAGALRDEAWRSGRLMWPSHDGSNVPEFGGVTISPPAIEE